MTLPDTAVDPVSADRTFQVDLRGLVDLLSHHLYSSPRVYLRELMQNAVDALTARRGLEPAAPVDAFGIRLYADGSVVRVEDDGVGLTEADVHTFLATIGRSSKRAEMVAEQRGDFIGQFGIGLLSCFLVADEIHVLSRSMRHSRRPRRGVAGTRRRQLHRPHPARLRPPPAGHHRHADAARRRGRVDPPGAGSRAGPALRLPAAPPGDLRRRHGRPGRVHQPR